MEEVAEVPGVGAGEGVESQRLSADFLAQSLDLFVHMSKSMSVFVPPGSNFGGGDEDMTYIFGRRIYRRGLRTFTQRLGHFGSWAGVVLSSTENLSRHIDSACMSMERTDVEQRESGGDEV
jgi:hypothetical protein